MIESFKIPSATFPTLTGSIVTFNSQYAGLPLKSHKIALTATQSGSGTPSPDNPRAINGYSAIVINNGSKNFMSNSPAETKSNNGIDVICDGHGIYTISGTATGGSANITFVLDVPVIIRSGMYLHFNNNIANANAVMTLQRKNNTGFSAPSITPVNRIYDLSGFAGEKLYSIRFYIANGTEFNATLKPMICFSSSAVDFVEYDGKGAEIQIGSTVYGGEYDARTGVLRVTHKGILARDVSGWAKSGSVFYRNFSDVWTAITPDTPTGRKPLLCSHFDYSSSSIVADLKVGYGGANNNGNIVIRYDALSTISDFNDYIANNDVFIVYPLATPQTIQLPPCPIETLLGENNIWADTGDTTLQYVKLG